MLLLAGGARGAPLGGCVTATDCDDADECTVDACPAGTCSNTFPSCASILCEFGAVAAAPCGAEFVPPKTARQFVRRAGRARRPLGRLCAGATGKEAERLRRKVDAKLHGIGRTAARLAGRKISPVCGLVLGELAEHLRQAVSALGG